MKKTMHTFWKEVYSDKGSYVDSYFHTYYKDEQNRVLEIDGDIQASLQVHPKRLSLHGKLLKTSFIVASLGSLSDQEALISSVLEEVSQRDLITMIQTNSPEHYESLGFETVIESRIYNMPSDMLPDFPMDGVILEPKIEDLMAVYREFTKHFTGYFDRNYDDFQRFRKHLKNQKGSIVGFMDDGVLKGYAAIINHGTYVEVLECAYDKSGTLLRLLSFVSRGISRIVFHASESERITRLFPDIKSKKVPFIMARINDKDLFERLYHIKIISSYSAFNAFGLPLLNHDLL